jgi:hypothetical protein
MNESTLTHLKVLVERAVRPVRASTPRKRRMREELLAHVLAVFEEEAANLGEERTALEQTAQRFGNPADLTGQLQESVPTTDYLAWVVEQLEGRPGESPVRPAARQALLAGALGLLCLLAAMLVKGPISDWPTPAVPPAAVFGIAIFTFGFTLLRHGMEEALYGPAGRSWLRAALVAAASAFLVPGLTFGLCLTFSGDVWSSALAALPLLPLAVVLTPLALVIVAPVAAAEIRYRQEWASLQID